MNNKKFYAILAENKKKILGVCPSCPEKSGIYILVRAEDGFKYAYVGQSKNILRRLAEHLQGYQHIDLSLKKHGLYSEDNVCGWRIFYRTMPECELDEMEKNYIKKYANAGYQMKNATVGGQGQGKTSLGTSKPRKTYYDGLAQGYKNAQKFVKNLFEKHLSYSTRKNPPTKNQEKAVEKFEDFLNID